MNGWMGRWMKQKKQVWVVEKGDNVITINDNNKTKYYCNKISNWFEK